MGRSSLRGLIVVRASLLALPFAFAFAFVPAREDRAEACSCMGPSLALRSPMGDGAPLNVHVRVEVPSPGAGAPAPALILREHKGAVVATQTRTIAGPAITLVELTPSAPLSRETRYEIATVDPTKHPPNTVIGVFKTGTATDVTPPKLDRIGAHTTHLNTHFGGGDCSIRGPWVSLSGIVAHDADRPDAELAYGVWQADTSGKLDTKRTPDALIFPYRGELTIGQSSLCDMSQFSFNAPAVTLAVAAFDDAGNASKPIVFRADVTRNGP
jgi:hypothetical protein